MHYEFRIKSSYGTSCLNLEEHVFAYIMFDCLQSFLLDVS